MAYTKTSWIDNSAPAIDAANLNNIEDGISKAPYGPDASSNQLPIWNGSAWTYGQVANAQISSSAAIALSKLADPGAGKVLGSSSGAAAVFPPGYEYDYKEATSSVNVTASSFASATTILTGNAVSYNGSTVVIVEIYCPALFSGASTATAFLNLWDGSTDLGIIGAVNSASGGITTAPVFARRKLTPSNASHTFSVRGTMNSGTGVFTAGAGGTGGTYMPGYIRVTQA